MKRYIVITLLAVLICAASQAQRLLSPEVYRKALEMEEEMQRRSRERRKMYNVRDSLHKRAVAIRNRKSDRTTYTEQERRIVEEDESLPPVGRIMPPSPLPDGYISDRELEMAFVNLVLSEGELLEIKGRILAVPQYEDEARKEVVSELWRPIVKRAEEELLVEVDADTVWYNEQMKQKWEQIRKYSKKRNPNESTDYMIILPRHPLIPEFDEERRLIDKALLLARMMLK